MDNRPDLLRKRVAVLMGGLSSEREISLKSGQAVLAGLGRRGYRAVPIDVDRSLYEQLRKERIEVAFVALHGRWGEDGVVQGLLEMMAIPYTGSGVLASALAMDKCLCKVLMESLAIPTPAYKISSSRDDCSFPLPFVIKPAREGSSVGISIVRMESEKEAAVETAFAYGHKVLIEKYIEGREITVGIVNGSALPIVEVRPRSGVYDFTSKYTKGMTEYVVPAEIAPDVERGAKEEALELWRRFDLAGCARIDMIVDHGSVPQVIDINTSPGMTETSLVPKAWEHLGKTFDELVEEILQGADLKA
jgi:D-alanine-D-alanine ligase